MKSPLFNIPSQTEVLIIGGGIVGAGLLRDLALNGVSSVLVDKKDFTSQTSSKSSKMLHGGIRYLENGDFPLVWEALHEKNLWQKLAPHLCKEQSFFLPVYENSARPLWMIRMGLFLYDLLSSFENRPHRLIYKEDTLKEIPGINEHGLKGAGVYHDVYMDDIKLALENIYDALCEKNIHALSYTAAYGPIKKMPDGSFQVQLKDELTQDKKEIKAKKIAVAAGPFTDHLMHELLPGEWKNCMLASQGSHLWIKKSALSAQSPLLLTPDDGRVIFVMPWEHAILVGTTEVAPKGPLFDVTPTKDEVDYLMSSLNSYFPDAHLKESDILSTFAGIRPLVKEESEGSLGKTAREHQTFRPYPGMHVITGGKYTTFRKMVQETAREMALSLNYTYTTQATLKPLRRPSIVQAFSDPKSITYQQIINCLKTEGPRTFNDLVIRRLGIPGVHHWGDPKEFKIFFSQISEELQKHLHFQLSDIDDFIARQNSI